MNDTTTLFLVRHGQTEWNIQHRFQGHQDSPLTELGIKQALWLGESIRNDPIDVIYSSSSYRAHRTAELIKVGREINIIDSDALREINLGIWEGRNQQEVKDSYPEQYDHFWNDPDEFHVQESESFKDVSERVVGQLNQIIDEHQGKSILIVTHSVAVKLIMAHFESRSMKDLWKPPYIHPVCLSKVEVKNDRFEIILHGDISHYQEETIDC